MPDRFEDDKNNNCTLQITRFKRMRKKIVILLLAALSQQVSAQKTSVPLDAAHWQIEGKVAVQDKFKGQDCFKLSEGSMLLKDNSFLNGIIEFDMAISGSRGFPGLGFRMVSRGNGEIYYLRPHQSGNPDAMQYYPEYHGASGWQLYYGDGFNKAHEVPKDQWIHLRLVILNQQAEVYLNHENEPALFIHSLKRVPKKGAIALLNDFPITARFANFSYEKTNDIIFKSKAPNPPELPKGSILDWTVSSPFDETRLLESYAINPGQFSDLSWQQLKADDRGIADLSRLSATGPSKNTVFVKMEIQADRQEIRKFSFGFSDKIRLYLNNRILYSGADEFLSRDYRFLGTIGLFDTVYLPLEKGKNEVWMAVSEDIGGWGIQGKLE